MADGEIQTQEERHKQQYSLRSLESFYPESISTVLDVAIGYLRMTLSPLWLGEQYNANAKRRSPF